MYMKVLTKKDIKTPQVTLCFIYNSYVDIYYIHTNSLTKQNYLKARNIISPRLILIFIQKSQQHDFN